MLKTRIIPCLDVKDGRVVKGVSFEQLVDAGDPVEAAIAYDRAGADELCFLDIRASHENRGTLLDIVRRTAEQCFMPLTVGGGVRTVEDVVLLLANGADKVLINTAAHTNPGLIREASEKVGAQAIVINIDATRVSKLGELPRWQVFSHVGHKNLGMDVIEYAQSAAAHGAGELLVTSKDLDGTRSGYDTELLRAVTSAVTIPVIASGGAGSVEHFVHGVTEGHASALLAASVFHFGTLTIGQVKEALSNAGVPVRMAS